MYFIDLSLRNPALGYVDSIALIAEVIGAHELYVMRDEAEDIAAIDSDDSMEALDDIIAKSEDIAADYGYSAFAYEGFYYVMTEAEADKWWADYDG